MRNIYKLVVLAVIALLYAMPLAAQSQEEIEMAKSMARQYGYS